MLNRARRKEDRVWRPQVGKRKQERCKLESSKEDPGLRRIEKGREEFVVPRG